MSTEESVLEIQGGRQLNGEVGISGAKNAVLPLMAAAVLTNRPVVLENVPNITDVESMKLLLASHGVQDVEIDTQNHKVTITATDPRPTGNDPTISGKLKGGFLLLGPLLARLGHAKAYLPGGDDIGNRPVDMHVANLRSLGATVTEQYTNEPFYVEARAPRGGLKASGHSLYLSKVSVGATQNTMMAACVALGTTVIENASIEPETLDLVKLLKSFGANIEVDKAQRKIKITGQGIEYYKVSTRSLSRYSINHTVIPDRIVAGTYAIAAAITGGNMELLMDGFEDAAILELLESEFWRLLAAGVEITRTRRGVRVARKRDAYGRLVPISPVSVVTKPYPGFPTDLHPQWAALMCFSNGQSWVDETIFDGRFRYVEALQNMGAEINYYPFMNNGKRVNINGNPALSQGYQPEVTVEAGDIRAGAALILVALARNGITKIKGLHHVERGYEDFENRFSSVGSQMRRRRR